MLSVALVESILVDEDEVFDMIDEIKPAIPPAEQAVASGKRENVSCRKRGRKPTK